MILSDEDKKDDGSVSQKYRESYANQTTWTKLKISCIECSIPFSAYQLSEHQLSEHTSKNFVCTSCPEQKTFFNLESFVNHTFTIHHEYLRYFCFICDEICWNYKALYNHYKSHKNYKANMCLICGKFHKSGYDLKMHKEVHSKPVKMDEIPAFKCNLCPKTYNRKLQLMRHQASTHRSEKHWICETCGVSFKSKSSLSNHASG